MTRSHGHRIILLVLMGVRFARFQRSTDRWCRACCCRGPQRDGAAVTLSACLRKAAVLNSDYGSTTDNSLSNRAYDAETMAGTLSKNNAADYSMGCCGSRASTLSR